MADLSPIVQGAGALLSVWGQWQAGRAAKAEGQLQAAAARLQANQMRRAAQQAVVAGQQRAQEELRNARLLASRAIVLSAAGGGDPSDPTISRILIGIADEGFRRAGVEFANAREEARGLRMQALATQFEGENAAAQGRVKQAAYRLEASTALLGAGASLYERYKGSEGEDKKAAKQEVGADVTFVRPRGSVGH